MGKAGRTSEALSWIAGIARITGTAFEIPLSNPLSDRKREL